MAIKHVEDASEGKVSKMEAVRQTLAAGIDKPVEAVAHIKEKFGLEVPTAIFSSYKSAINSKKGSKPGKRGRKPAATTNGHEDNGQTLNRRDSNDKAVTLARDVKKLVDTYGAEAVKGMADVFAG